MYFYEIALASNKYHGKNLLTYSSNEELSVGDFVKAPLMRGLANGFVVKKTSKPEFKTKPIESKLPFPPLPLESIRLFTDLMQHYPAPLGIMAQLFMPTDFPQKIKNFDDTSPQIPPHNTDITPTKSQASAIKTLSNPGTYVLHGETGSGKTLVYIELAKKCIKDNKSAIILTPEIGLTSQLTQSFENIFGNEIVTVIHSQLSPATRRDIWIKSLSSSNPQIVIGPRSALFSPLRNIGLIAIDESHEYAYKQENTPFYHASRVASMISNIHKSSLVLGSATPSVTDYFLAESRNRPIVKMTTVDENKDDPEVITVDMRKDENKSTNHHLSKRLLSEIKKKINNNQQVLLFINRRGTARIILCESCGWQAACQHCDLPLTYHHDEHLLRCHTCGISEKAVSSCKECSGTEIILKSIGAKSVEQTIKKLFPAAKVQRFDGDNKKGERLNELYDSVKTGDIDILIGTQLLAKGLDLPKLGLVGVLNADASLYIPDFSSQERTYQLLYQLIGRVGRSSQSGESSVVIQTYSPDNPTIAAASRKNWNDFYNAELKEREEFMFPPFCHLLKATCKKAKYETARSNSIKTAKLLENSGLSIQVDGPAPAFHEKAHGKYVWQIIIKSKRRSELIKAISLLPPDWSFDIDPVNLL